MSQILSSTFTAYQQTEQEQLVAMSISVETQQFIQTQIVRIAEERLALKPDPNNYAEFVQSEAYLKGQLDFAKYLLDCAQDAATQMRELAEASGQ